MDRQRRIRTLLLTFVLTVGTAGCGDSNDNGGGPPAPTATPTLASPRTATPTGTPFVQPTPVPTNTPNTMATPSVTPNGSGAVGGLVVVNRSVISGGDDALGSPPQPWTSQPKNWSFDRALSNADWSVDGSGQQGMTGPDGQFAISGLTPGRHMLILTKTLDGNLASMSIPFFVGSDGHADVVAEVSWGLVRSVSTYMQDGVTVEEIVGPYGSWLTLRDGRISGFGDGGRSFDDPNGDGKFDVSPCSVLPPITCVPEPSPTCGNAATCLPPSCLPAATDWPPCNSDGTCPNSGDRCVCVPSCPACDDCPSQVCVSGCDPVDITAVTITSAPSQLVIGQQGSATAAVQLSDGSQFDVTYLADWQSSDPTVATIDSWGGIAALALGTTNLTAKLGTVTSDPASLEVVDRPTLQRIDIQNVSCFYPRGLPADYGKTPPEMMPPDAAMPYVPSCNQVVQIGKTLQFRAIGEFANGYYQDITDEVQWQLTPPDVGDVVAGTFTAKAAGSATLTATLGSVVSEGSDIRVVTEPTVVALSISADNGVIVFMGPPVQAGVAVPCMDVGPGVSPCCCVDSTGAQCNCGYLITVLRGDELKFHANAQYDTGEWRDVTAEVTWRSGNTAAATIDGSGVMAAVEAGDTDIDATLGDVASNTVSVRVVDQATLQYLYITQEGTDRVVSKGDQLFFKAQGNYDVGFGRDVTTEATWHSSDENIGGFDAPGVFTGRAAGTVQIWAELDGQASQPQISLEVYETSALDYCDLNNINRAVWSDDFNRVTLESDCAHYTQPGVAALRYTVTQTQPRGGTFAPCLDLYVFQDGHKLRTIREQGCGDLFAAPGAATDAEVLKYQLRAFWDLKDETGAPVPPGTYTIYGRFYLYYDPVVSIDVTVLAPGQATPTPKPSVLQSPTPTWPVVCTPPPCPPGGTLYCPGWCPNGCGYMCDIGTATPTPVGPVASIQVGSASGFPGDLVSFTVSLSTAGQEIAGIQNDLSFEADTPISANAVGVPDCTVNPALHKGASKVAFQPPGCSGTSCTGIRALIFAVDNIDLIPDGSVVYTCNARIAASANLGIHPLNPSRVAASSPQGNPLPATGTSGTIMVLGGGPLPICTPPLCGPGEVFFCPGDCPGGCGTICVTATPSPTNPSPTPVP